MYIPKRNWGIRIARQNPLVRRCRTSPWAAPSVCSWARQGRGQGMTNIWTIYEHTHTEIRTTQYMDISWWWWWLLLLLLLLWLFLRSCGKPNDWLDQPWLGVAVPLRSFGNGEATTYLWWWLEIVYYCFTNISPYRPIWIMTPYWSTLAHIIPYNVIHILARMLIHIKPTRGTWIQAWNLSDWNWDSRINQIVIW